MTTGIMDFNTDGSVTETPLSFGEVKEMVHIAHEEGFSVMAHTNGARAVREVVEAGADSVEIMWTGKPYRRWQSPMWSGCLQLQW